MKLLDVFSVVAETILAFHAAKHHWHIRRLQDRSLNLALGIITWEVVEWIICHIGIKICGCATNVQGHDIAKSWLVSITVRQ
jgi:hypothetical protein